jgi:hypothetical protein
MSASLTIEVKDRASAKLREQMAKCSGARLNAAVGPAVTLLVKRNYLSLPHNRKGWAPVNFWADAARATNWTSVVDGVVVSTNKIGVRQRYQGGWIRPVNAKALAFPVAEEAYGKTPADFPDQLQLVVIKGKGAWLALKSFEPHGQTPRACRKQIQGPAVNTLRERLKFMFLLSYGVNQPANPAVLPSDEEIFSTVTQAAEAAIK